LVSVLGELDPTLVWGLFTRLLGLTYLVAFASLHSQVIPIAGARGLNPVAQLLAQIRTDLPPWRRPLYFPTLLWLSASDQALRALVLVGCGSALLVICGGPWSRWALLACWLAWLSLDPAIELTYPWDSVLFEAGFLALFIAPLDPLPALTAVATPPVVVALGFNLLLLRIVWGFGKYKFVGMTRKDFGFLREFLINQPIPSGAGWYAYHLPAQLFRLGLLLLFVVELPLPLLLVLDGPLRLLPALGIAGLMVAIQLCGNFGFFNLIVLTLCLPLLDQRSPFTALRLDQATASWPAALLHLGLGLLFVGGLLYFPFNSWCTRAWLYWPATLTVRPRWLRWLLAGCRELAAFRLVHAYGVFPPQTVPGVRFIPVVEGSLDGQTWREYEYRFIPSIEHSPPRSIAPFQPRWDHYIFYEGYGLNPAEFLSSTAGGSYNPYLFSASPPLERLIQRLTEPGSPVLDLLAGDPFVGEPRPRQFRVRLFALLPTSLAARRRTGRWWTRQLIGTHLPERSANPAVYQHHLNGPELFYWDAAIWRRRAPVFVRFEQASRAAVTIEQLELATAELLGLPGSVIARFWSELLPAVQPGHPDSWCDLATIVDRARQRFGPAALHEFERIAAALALGLAARLEPRLFDTTATRLALPSYFHLGLLTHQLLLRGRDRFAEVLRDTTLVQAEAAQLAPAGGLWLWGVFRFEILMHHARSLSLMLGLMNLTWVPILPGFLLMAPFLANQPVEDGRLTAIELSRRIDDGSWLVRFPPPSALVASR
jgi:Lipase maturation factor